ncbi:putative ribonuclease H-like domain-containing protein, partial [Tanacetum coccineum]
AISRLRGLSIPGPIQSQPQQPTQGTDPKDKDKGKGILVEEPKKKKMTLQQIRALETTNDEEVARKLQDSTSNQHQALLFQVTPKVSHLHAVKRIYSDYAGDNHDRRSMSGGCQYLGRRLVSWQCKKQTIVAISSTEAEYVAAASCCAQVLSLYLFSFINSLISNLRRTSNSFQMATIR